MFFCFIFKCFSNPFSKISESSRAWIIFIISFISSFEIIKVVFPEPFIYFFWNPASIVEAAAVIPDGAKTFFAKGIAIFINGPANLLYNDLKNPPDWIILEIWALESIKSVDILLLKAFLTFYSLATAISTILLGITLYSFQKIGLLNPLSSLNNFDNFTLSSDNKVTIGT